MVTPAPTALVGITSGSIGALADSDLSVIDVVVWCPPAYPHLSWVGVASRWWQPACLPTSPLYPSDDDKCVVRNG